MMIYNYDNLIIWDYDGPTHQHCNHIQHGQNTMNSFAGKKKHHARDNDVIKSREREGCDGKWSGGDEEKGCDGKRRKGKMKGFLKK